MPGGTPITANGRIALSYTINGLTHVTRMRCRIQNPTGPAPYLLFLQSGGTAAWGPLAKEFDPFLSPYYSAATAFGNYTLYSYSGGSYVPVDSVASAAVGTNTSPDQSCGQVTLFMRDATQKAMKLDLFESSFLPPFRVTGAGLGAFATFMADMENPTATHIGDWMVGRDSNPASRSISAVGTLNLRIRRRRGLA